MQSKSRGIIYILTISLIVLFYIGYRYGFKDRYYNLYSKSFILDLNHSNKAYLIEKHKEQNAIQQLELTIKGKLSDNITLYISKDAQNATQAIRIKSGYAKTSFSTSWNQDLAYILIDNPNDSKSQLEIEYQFIAK